MREYPNERTSYWGSQWEIIKSFLVFGCVSFGGPQVHITMMHEEFVMKRKWIDDNMFSELLGIGQSIPGPTSSQMVTAIGAIRGRGFLGGLLAFACFQLPGAVVMILAALASDMLDSYLQTPPWWIRGIERGLANSAVALVAISVLRLGSKLVVTKFQKALCVVAAIVTIAMINGWIFPTLIVVCGFATWLNFLRERWNALQKKSELQELAERTKLSAGDEEVKANENFNMNRNNNNNDNTILEVDNVIEMKGEQLDENDPSVSTIEERSQQVTLTISSATGVFLFVVFVGILVGSIILRRFVFTGEKDVRELDWFETFYRFGSLIFGGGQVVIPMILNELVTELKWITARQFFNGLAVVNALPGPMFNISAYLGMILGGYLGAIICWTALFGPGLILIFAILPFWKRLRKYKFVIAIMEGVNAAAIGLIVSAVYLLWIKTVFTSYDASMAVLIFSVVWIWNLKAPLAILLSGVVGFLAALIGLYDFNIDSSSNR